MKLFDFVFYDFAKLLDGKIKSSSPYGARYAGETLAFHKYDAHTHKSITVVYLEGEVLDVRDAYTAQAEAKKTYLAPTYAEVIDWLYGQYIVFEFSPAFTYALKNNVAYNVSAFKVNKDEGRLDVVFENKMEMYSFELAIYEITKKLLEQGII